MNQQERDKEGDDITFWLLIAFVFAILILGVEEEADKANIEPTKVEIKVEKHENH